MTYPAAQHPQFAAVCAAHPECAVLLYRGRDWEALITVPKHHPKTGRPQKPLLWSHGDVIEPRFIDEAAA